MYSIGFQVPAPVEAYKALHAAVQSVTDSASEGLVVHVARPTDAGFEVIEIWQSKEHFERFMVETLPKAAAQLPPMGAGAPVGKEFDLCGLLVFAPEPIVI